MAHFFVMREQSGIKVNSFRDDVGDGVVRCYLVTKNILHRISYYLTIKITTRVSLVTTPTRPWTEIGKTLPETPLALLPCMPSRNPFRSQS